MHFAPPTYHLFIRFVLYGWPASRLGSILSSLAGLSVHWCLYLRNRRSHVWLIKLYNLTVVSNIMILVADWWEGRRWRRVRRCTVCVEAILIKYTHTLSTGSIYVSKKKNLHIFGSMKPLKKTIVFMFYCKDVKYDMCELKKIMIRKIKYAKQFHDLTFSSLRDNQSSHQM